MKVHVTVDDSIYPELHELMEATPISKRARVLANLAFKACLLSNAALMNSEIAAPPKGRGSNSKKKKSTTAVKAQRETDKPVIGEEKSQTKESENDKLSIQMAVRQDVTESLEVSDESTSNNSLSVVGKPISVDSHGMGMPERNLVQGGASDQQNNADGERSVNSAPLVPNKRKRRILG